MSAAEQNNLHRFMNTADALLICQVAPGQRRLRVSHFPEASMGLTALVSCGVASFFLLYFGLLLLFFTVRPALRVSSASSQCRLCLDVARFHPSCRMSLAWDFSAFSAYLQTNCT